MDPIQDQKAASIRSGSSPRRVLYATYSSYPILAPCRAWWVRLGIEYLQERSKYLDSYRGGMKKDETVHRAGHGTDCAAWSPAVESWPFRALLASSHLQRRKLLFFQISRTRGPSAPASLPCNWQSLRELLSWP